LSDGLRSPPGSLPAAIFLIIDLDDVIDLDDELEGPVFTGGVGTREANGR
jgi:hypothetical protein